VFLNLVPQPQSTYLTLIFKVMKFKYIETVLSKKKMFFDHTETSAYARCAVVENSTHKPKIEGLNPAKSNKTERIAKHKNIFSNV
jgi:hypothetical protein